MVHPGLRPEKGVIPESTKRRLEQQYHPQNVIDPQLSYESNQPNRLHQLLGSRASSSPSSNAQPRRLPSRDVTDQTLDNAYVGFVMYCNPSVPLGTDVGELKKIFRSPPKSDGKNFNTFTLYELIRKLELKELKTWAQLALELGVEPPAFEKGQSAQKVQQYAVRLKVSICSSSLLLLSECELGVVGFLGRESSHIFGILSSIKPFSGENLFVVEVWKAMSFRACTLVVLGSFYKLSYHLFLTHQTSEILSLHFLGDIVLTTTAMDACHACRCIL